MSSQRILDTGNKILVDRPSTNVPRNTFDLSHDVKLTANFGNLSPICVLEVLPGDIFHINSEALLRFQPMIAPVMHRINLRSEWFFVPNRLLWPNWEDFISPQYAGDSPVRPFFSAITVASGDLSDYLGLPIGANSSTGVSALPFAAYQKIMSDWYVDEDLNPSEGLPFTELTDGDNVDLIEYFNVVQQRNWDRDYFTSCKPWPQKGDAVVIPIALGDLPVSPVGGDGHGIPASFYQDPFPTDPAIGSPSFSGAANQMKDSLGNLLNLAVEGELSVSLTDVLGNAGTINDLRAAEALQRFLEADLRGGTRYVELIKQQFDVYSSDKRMQRSEYLGSTFQPISISEVLNTTGTDDAAQGQMAGHGVAVTKHSDGIHYMAEEHGFIFGIMSVLPVTGYFQGVPKMFLRLDRLDYAWPQLAELGEQEVIKAEIYLSNDSEIDGQVFGYLPRYSEYRLQMNRVCGDFKGDLNFWHLDRLFSSLPALNDGFVQCLLDESLNRIFAVIDVDVAHLLAHWFHNIHVERKLPRYVKPASS